MLRAKKGFTLIELLVVISVIGVLSTVAMTSLGSARAKARDARRKSDLSQIYRAFELYYSNYGTYNVAGTGWGGTGSGWFNYKGGSYTKSMAEGLEENNYFQDSPRDPKITSDSQTPQYMKYNCGNGLFIYAILERPSAEDLASYTASKSAGCANLDVYGMNYAYGRK